MRTPKLAVVSAAVLIALTGCGQANDSSGAGSPGAATTSAPADPAARIDAASKKMEQSSFKFSIDAAGMKAEGVRHQPSDSMSMTMKGAAEGKEFTIEMVQISKDIYMKMDFGLDPGDDPELQGFADALSGWRHITQEQAKADVGSLAAAGAQAMGSSIAKQVTELKETAPNTFTGTVDLTKSNDLDVTDAETLAALGDKAKAVPVTITLDSEERLSSMVLDIPGAGKIKAQQTTIKFFDFDNVTQPKAPPADQIKES
ncbi:hypothetical protein O7635_13540 [Asanoa sp. WMMD1127]|uniref:hypothetical protein n=1 Tax=Asanoa sp. WMMD1127 TaxID=3016107 RepID=UPI002415B10C|nr:hypothetical protein [Asanoa sp. WMMD1127]MDG4822873.1 hypothetical protein [Asanoa sp. WMMD1127]